MCLGYALTVHRFAAFPLRTAGAWPSGRPIVAFVASIFFVAVLAAQAQESIEPDILPSLADPPASSVEPPPSTSAEALPAVPESLPSAPLEPLPSPAASLPSSEEGFPASRQSLSSSMNYTGGYTTVVPAPVATGPNGVFPGGEPIESGEPRRLYYKFGLTVRGVWDDNIFISHTNRVSDYYFAIEPQITIGVGDIEGRNKSYLRLDYMPSAILFVDHSDEDAFNQLIHLEGGYRTGRWTLTMAEDIALLESANLNSFFDTTGLWANTDASGPTRVNIFSTRLRADYQLTAKVFLQGEFDSWTYFYPNNISSYAVAGGLYIYYSWLPKLSVGIGGTVGYEWVDDPTANQPFEQVNLRLNYEATAKLNLYASVGVEFRQFDDDRGTYTTPVFEVGANYRPFEGTYITLAAGRRIYSSGY